MLTGKKLFALAQLAIAGCAMQPTSPADKSHAAPTVTYSCSDGQIVQATYPDANTALVRIHGSEHVLHVVISGSGARYTGDGWQWWTKGMHDGMLAPLAADERIASAPGIACHAG